MFLLDWIVGVLHSEPRCYACRYYDVHDEDEDAWEDVCVERRRLQEDGLPLVVVAVVVVVAAAAAGVVVVDDVAVKVTLS